MQRRRGVRQAQWFNHCFASPRDATLPRQWHPRRMSKWLPPRGWRRVLAAVSAVFVLMLIVFTIAARHAPTLTTPGPEAEALAREMVQAVGGDAWERTGAVAWRLFGHDYLWDRGRGLTRVEWGNTRVLLDIGKQTGRVYRDGQELSDAAERDKLVKRAYAFFINDMFWLNPVVKAFDDGTTRARGQADGKRALLVSYSSGGLTPGDRYLWILDENARPERWRLWVHVLPIGGAEATWEGWTQLATGAWVATRHQFLGLASVQVHDLRGAATLAELTPGADPFALLL
jgi:hypothetical protein